MSSSDDQTKPVPSTRRDFLRTVGIGTAAAGTAALGAPIRYFQPMQIDNPLLAYPTREWERVFRNIFEPDYTFHFLCAPNDTHNCLLRAHVKNGVVTRIGPSYGYGKATDLYGNQASARWDPRLCQKGLALVRRVYGDRRVKAPMVRKGFKEWVDQGFPRDAATGKPDPKYFQRGKDSWVRVKWDQANDYMAKALENIARTYSGPEGAKRLTAQGYDPSMIDAMEGAGVRSIKLRGGMAFLGATRIFGLYRFANLLALLDAKIRNVGPDKALGGTGWDSYSWHTDLPPGHPMVTGAQTNDFDLFSTEHAKLILCWGMNWITTKMPDSHWLTEARLKGAKIVAITVEYSATASRTDEVVVIRPGSDPAFALGVAQTIIKKKLYDEAFVSESTDLPFLVRLDTLQPLRPEEVLAGYTAPAVANLDFFKKGEAAPASAAQKKQFAPEKLRDQFRPYLVKDAKTKKLVPVTRDEFGAAFAKKGVKPTLEVREKVKLLDGQEVEVASVFSLTRQYLDENFTAEQASAVTGAPVSAFESMATQIAKAKEGTLFAVGMGPNQFFNSDLKDRAIFLVAALTRNVGFPGGNVGSYAGNYRASLFGGEGVYANEDPFNLALEAGQAPKQKKYLHYESLHYFNYGDRPLRVGKKLFSDGDHRPCPTKAMWLNNSNSVIGNIKWHFDVVMNTLPKLELIAYQDWWWTGSCEYSDVVLAVDSWAETKDPDMTASCTNPFVQMYPTTPLHRIFDTRGDLQAIAGVSARLGELVKEPRLKDGFKFVDEGKVHEYLQRIVDHSCQLKGYESRELERKAAGGVPALMNNRTYPRVSSYEQARGEQPWHTRSGRLEMYRPEAEFIDSGENMIVYREPVDSTHHEPNVIVGKPHPAIRFKRPEDYGLDPKDLSTETRQVRNVLKTVDELLASKHPLKQLQFTHVYHTPKYRHGAHSTPVDTDYTAVWFGPFGDVYRHDKRMPSNTEGYVDINPLDAKALGVEDGDYVWIDADPSDRPYRGYKPGAGEEARLSRLLLRARYYPGTPRGVARTWHNMYGATFGSVKASLSRADGLAKNAETQYQAMYRTGSHQSATRAWLRPTLMTQTLVHKALAGQGLETGFAPDVHCPIGAPRESFVKITRAEPGGLGGQGMYRPAALGFRPTYESATMKDYLAGKFIKRKG